MSEVSVKAIKTLRERTGAGMMDCKKALEETGADLDSAVDWLRTNGLAAAAKKAGRVAAEGLVAVTTDGARGVVVELNSETDFVARNPDFQKFVGRVAASALAVGGDLDATMAAVMDDGKTVTEAIREMVGTIGENLLLRRSAGLSVNSGVVETYVHNTATSGMGRIGVLVGLESEAAPDKLEQLGKQLAMHVAATGPLWITRDDVDAASLERERSVLAEQARASGRPEAIVEKMIDGRMRKFFEEVCLLEQTYAIDGETRVSKVLEKASQDLGTPVQLTGFVRFQLGEGVEKKDSDFAAEVAATARG